MAAVRPQVKYPLRWPVSAALERPASATPTARLTPIRRSARPHLDRRHPAAADQTPRDARPHRLGDRERPGATLASRLVGEPGGPDVDVGVPWGSDHRAVASTFDVTAAPAPPLAHAEPRVVDRGSTVTIRYIGARGTAKRVGILPAGGGRPLVSLPIADTSTTGPPSSAPPGCGQVSTARRSSAAAV